jgi:hypothetical protein
MSRALKARLLKVSREQEHSSCHSMLGSASCSLSRSRWGYQRASERAKKRALGKDGLTGVIVGRVRRRAWPRAVRGTATIPSARQPQHFSVPRVHTRIISGQVVSSIC